MYTSVYLHAGIARHPHGRGQRDNASTKNHTAGTPSYRGHALSANKFFLTMSVYGHGDILILVDSRLDCRGISRTHSYVLHLTN